MSEEKVIKPPEKTYTQEEVKRLLDIQAKRFNVKRVIWSTGSGRLFNLSIEKIIVTEEGATVYVR